ncbi:hypothetical protein ACQ4LK_24130, partial [Bacillus pumilus]
MQLTLRFFQKKPSAFHLTIYQTPEYGAASGHQPVYRTKIGGRTHPVSYTHLPSPRDPLHDLVCGLLLVKMG